MEKVALTDLDGYRQSSFTYTGTSTPCDDNGIFIDAVPSTADVGITIKLLMRDGRESRMTFKSGLTEQEAQLFVEGLNEHQGEPMGSVQSEQIALVEAE
ncbi:MAG: hypothetical protein HOH43_04620 [Candidatus Latescibacteria bacterium]|jgi:hypothetical protein|nr:hypothetical protein [Candidatus Latescibacterota bacterium]